MVEHFRRLEDALSSVRGKTLTQAVFADITLGLSKVKSSVIECLSSRPTALTATVPALPPLAPSEWYPPLTPYADALKRASSNVSDDPTTTIHTAVLNEMKKTVIQSSEASYAERVCSNELRDQESRKGNAIMYGIPEETEAADVLEAVMAACSVTPPTTEPVVTRLGPTQGNRSRPVRVKFASPDDADKLFSNLSALRGNDEFKNVSIAHDLTRHQANIRNELRATAKERSSNVQIFRVVGRPNEWHIVQKRQ
jgi:hypothetical protein